MADILVGIISIIVVVSVVYYQLKKKKGGGCHGCSGCQHNSSCKKKQKDN